MDSKLKILKFSLLAGAIYFALVSIAHMIGYKVPILFVYFDVPSYPYQDRIISFLAFGWAIFLFTAFLNPKNKDLIKAILIAGTVAIIGLVIINLTTDFTILSKDININYFWMETMGLLVYILWLIYFYIKSGKINK